MHPKQAVAAALAVCVGAMWLAIDVPDEADCSDPAGIEVRTAPRIAQPPVDLDAPGGIPDRRPCAEETSRRPADPPPQPLDSLQPGGLILGAIDRETGRPLDAFTVRLASATRFAEENLQSGQGVIDILLTPDTYEGLVMAPGYEPVLLAPVAVGSGAIVRLGPVALPP